MSLVFRRRRSYGEDPGLYWRPKGAGYTLDIADAGLFEGGHEQPNLPWEEVPALPLLQAESIRLRQLLAGVDASISACQLWGRVDQALSVQAQPVEDR